MAERGREEGTVTGTVEGTVAERGRGRADPDLQSGMLKQSNSRP